LKLAIGALGVVFGDIGTSPLYAIKQSFHPGHGLALAQHNVYGILSLVFWSLVLVVCINYLGIIMRADNHGEGGITALLSLIIPRVKAGSPLILLGIVGTGLLYGDGVITPSLTVLSAVEGLEVATPAFKPFIVPITVAILILLFSFQRKGTASIGAVFGAVTLVWFLTISLISIPWLMKHPEIFRAVNPVHASRFLMENGYSAFIVLGAVFLCVTGAEALYADMGHFGKGPIRLAWYVIVFPALLLNYFGQGALILARGAAGTENPFFGMVEGIWLYPLVIISTLASVIASQALISGAYSLTQQAVQLGYLPRTTIRHTSREVEGQIYVPLVNMFLMVLCIAVVVIFEDSSKLAEAYGIAVTGTMLITSILFFNVMRKVWGNIARVSTFFLGLFFIAVLFFLAANLVKLKTGGWIPLSIALFVLASMTTWKRGRMALSKVLAEVSTPLDDFFKHLLKERPHRVRGTAVFMTLNRDIAPSVLLHYYKHAHCLHERIILLSILTEHDPEVPNSERVRVTDLPEGFVKVVARYGYMQTPSVSNILKRCEAAGLKIDYEHISYYLGRESFVTTGNSGMAKWRKKMFVLMARNARPATEFFSLPPDRVIEIGTQIQI
jgi:KUP system potassium uptake protein